MINTQPNIPDPDEFYAELLDAHEGLSDTESQALNARLILILANHIGERHTLRAALATAKAMQIPRPASAMGEASPASAASRNFTMPKDGTASGTPSPD